METKTIATLHSVPIDLDSLFLLVCVCKNRQCHVSYNLYDIVHITHA